MSLFGGAPTVTPGPHALANAAAAASRPPPLDYSRFVCIYPVYINSEATLAEGRKVRKDQGVPKPQFRELHEAAKALQALHGLTVALEPMKRHPRDFFTYGRVRVQLKRDGQLVSAIKNRNELYVEFARLTLEAQKKLQAAQPAAGGAASSSSAAQAAASSASASTAAASASSSGAPSSGGKKKKGKK